jgi:hypothetical protein
LAEQGSGADWQKAGAFSQQLTADVSRDHHHIEFFLGNLISGTIRGGGNDP